MNPNDLLRAADVVENRALLFGNTAPQGRIYQDLAARLRAAAERSGEAVKVPKGWQITPIKCGGCGRGSNQNCGRHPDKACMREFCDKQPRTAWADPLPDVIRPAQPIPQGERSDESQFEKALNNVAQKAMDYSRNTDFGGEDDDRLRALDAAKNHVIRLHADALAWAQRSKP